MGIAKHWTLGLVAAGSILAALGPSGVVRAQSMNYGALEQLYGEPVTTSVTGKPQRASDAPADIVIISADDIRRSGANNIPDILRFVTGLDVRRYGAADADVAIRGYNQPFNPRLLVMINGRQVYMDIYGNVTWQALPVQLEEIRQIEVVKGPTSALFGFNAASGVINIITYDPMFDTVNAGTLRAGSQDLLQGSAVATIHAGEHAGLRMSVGGLRQDEYEQVGFAKTIGRSPRSGSFNLDAKARIAPGVEAMLEGSYVSAQTDELTALGFPSFDTYHTNSIKAGVMADTAWGTFALNAYRNWVGLGFDVGFLSIPLANTVYVVQGSDTLKLGSDHTVRMSLEYRDNTLKAPSLSGGDIGYQVHSAAAMWDWQITPSVSLTNSGRLDHLTLNYGGDLLPEGPYSKAQYNSTTITQPSFNSGLVYKITDIDTVRLTAGRGLQVPSLADFGLQVRAVTGTGVVNIGSPTLQPTAVWNAEIGYDRAVGSVNSTLRTAVFAQRNDRLLTSGLNTLPMRLPSGAIGAVSANVGYSDAMGVEVGIKGQSPSGFRWNTSYAFIGITDHVTLNKVAITSPQNYQNGSPTSVVIVGGGYSWDKLELDAQGRWQSRFTDYRFTGLQLQPVAVSDYFTFLARAGYNLTEHLTAALTAQQFNSRLLQSAGPLIERSAIASLTLHY